MNPDYATEVVQQARDGLTEYAVIRADLPNRIIAAHRLGIDKSDIAALSGLSRGTVARWIEAREFADQLRGELGHAAAAIEPGPGALARIRDRIRPERNDT